MRKNILIILLSIISFLFLNNNITFAHPGNTAADGCHYCRTNCDKWGVARNQRHCHGGNNTIKTNTIKYNINPTYSNTNNYKYIKNGYFLNSILYCNLGYTTSLKETYCVKIPENAYANKTDKGDVWLCNTGYKEVGNSCIKEKTKDELCNEKYNGTIYRLSDDRCICPGEYPDLWDINTKSCYIPKK